jgi:hypothetical protein
MIPDNEGDWLAADGIGQTSHVSRRMILNAGLAIGSMAARGTGASLRTHAQTSGPSASVIERETWMLLTYRR